MCLTVATRKKKMKNALSSAQLCGLLLCKCKALILDWLRNDNFKALLIICLTNTLYYRITSSASVIFFNAFCLFYFLRVSLCNHSCPQIHGKSPASVSQVLQLKARAITPSIFQNFKKETCSD